MIEELLNEIPQDYYLTSEYRNWLVNLNSDCEQGRIIPQEYCWQALTCDMFVAHRNEVICYLLQDPFRCEIAEHELYIDMCLYMAFKAKQGERANYVRELPKDDTICVLECNYQGHELLPRMRGIVARYCVNPPVSHDRHKSIELIDVVRGNTEQEKIGSMIYIKNEIKSRGFDGKERMSSELFANFLFQLCIRNDNVGLKRMPTAAVLAQLTGKAESNMAKKLDLAKDKLKKWENAKKVKKEVD